MKCNTDYHDLNIRLKQAFMEAGLQSATSAIGVKASPLAKYLGVSVQTIRKYLAGDVYPNLEKITQIADFLKVSPAWLAFGEAIDYKNMQASNSFEIKKIFLQEIIRGLFNNILNIQLESDLQEATCDFLYGIINDIAQLEAAEDIKLRLIKTSIASAKIMEKITCKKLATTI
jgi:transcriptional regulator with XRE-family HTH domain